MKKITYVFYFAITLIVILGCEKLVPPSTSGQGNPAKGTDNYDAVDSNVPCTLTYSIYNNDQYNYTLNFPDGYSYYVASYGYVGVTFTYSGCGSVSCYDGTYFEGYLSFCPCSDGANYTIDWY